MIIVANVIEEGRLGGPQIRMVRVAKSLSDSVETVIVMPFSESESFQEMCRAHGILYRTVKVTRIARDFSGILKFLLTFPLDLFRLSRLFSSVAPDLVHASGGSWQYKPVLAAYLAGIPVVWHLNDTSMPLVIRAVFGLLSRFSRGFIFASSRSCEYYQRLVPAGRMSAIVPAPVDSNFFSASCECSVEQEFEDLCRDRFVVGMVANINPIKGVEDFLKAARMVQENVRNTLFLIVGPVFDTQRRYFDELQNFLRDNGIQNVKFVGGKKDVRPYLKRFDVYVCSSLAESSPVSVWEAMAMEKAVVSTDVGDVPVHIQDGKNGYIVPVGDTGAMCERILYLYGNPEVRERIGVAARDEVKRSLSPEIVAEKTLSFYRRVLDSLPQQ